MWIALPSIEVWIEAFDPATNYTHPREVVRQYKSARKNWPEEL